MGQQQSKDKLLYQQVSDGNIDEIKSLRAAGASLEWTDKEGKTPLSVACMNPELYNVAKTLIDSGADINAYPLGYYAATPMHHAAERGLDQTVQLLLSHIQCVSINPIKPKHYKKLDKPKQYIVIQESMMLIQRVSQPHGVCISKDGCGYGQLGMHAWLYEQNQSKEELVYQQVSAGNIDAIKYLCANGASLEWTNKEGMTPLIAACMNSELYDVAKTLIDLGADINAYRPGRHAGTPLHHAANMGLDQTVQLLLSHRANALVMNDDCQTPLDMARSKGCSKVVRTIEAHICLFSGWLRELHALSFLEILAPQFLCRKVWVVVLPRPCLMFPFKVELAIYTDMQDAQPRTIVPLWQANIEEPNVKENEPVVIISDTSTGTRLKLTVLSENGKPELCLFCNACKGIPQVNHSSFPFLTEVPVHASAPVYSEDAELAMAIEASLQSLTLQSPDPRCRADASSSTINLVDVFTEKPIPSAQPDEVKEDGTSSYCVICLDAPIEGACIPCGHMACCMSCLNGIKEKNLCCPVCRANINQVLRIYSV